ncbi:hypothetical protein ACB092_07G145300 [Castanea dentata]
MLRRRPCTMIIRKLAAVAWCPVHTQTLSLDSSTVQYASSTKGVSMHLANRSETPSKSKTASQKEEMEKIY